MSGLLARIDLKNLTYRAVMIPLLQKLLFVRDRVTLDEILKLGEVGIALKSAHHYGSYRSQRPIRPVRPF